MAKFTIINTFKNIYFDIDKKPLVICDIDLTIIKPEYNIDHYRNILQTDFYIHEELEDMAKYMFHNALGLGFIKATDKEGFVWLNEEVEKRGGKLILLTARGIISHEKTLKDLARAGIKNPDKYEIHYTNGIISKGEYIKKHNLLNEFQHISFIDDYPDYLSSAFDIYPHINCYLFKCD